MLTLLHPNQAPELLISADHEGSALYGPEVDVYSASMCIYFMITGQTPFQAKSASRLEPPKCYQEFGFPIYPLIGVNVLTTRDNRNIYTSSSRDMSQ
jgi:serine/threonine protein kinase